MATRTFLTQAEALQSFEYLSHPSARVLPVGGHADPTRPWMVSYPDPTLAPGTRVRVTPCEGWTKTARTRLMGIEGQIEQIEPWTSFGASREKPYLVTWGYPVAVNPISTFERAWFSEDELTLL